VLNAFLKQDINECVTIEQSLKNLHDVTQLLQQRSEIQVPNNEAPVQSTVM